MSSIIFHLTLLGKHATLRIVVLAKQFITPFQRRTFMGLFNRDAEMTIIGHALATKELPPLGADDFGDHLTREIFKAMTKAHNESDDLEIIEVSNGCSQSISQLMDIMDGVPSNINIKKYIDIIKDFTIKRSFYKLINTYSIEDMESQLQTSAQILGEFSDKFNDIASLGAAPRNLSAMVYDHVMMTDGDFSMTNVYKCLQVMTRQGRNAVSQALARLVKKGVIERVGTVNGVFRKVNTEIVPIDFLNVDASFIPFKWPMGLQRYYNLMPKNIVMVAGEPDSGKTAFMLNIVRANMFAIIKQFDRPLKYFSSEMGAYEFRSRLEQFAYIEDENPLALEEWEFQPYERAADFQDVIEPNGVNIIDFLEIHDNFWEVGGKIQKIFDKLENGVAIVAIQKNRGNQYGRGGGFGAEKARLYVNLNRSDEGDHEIEIAKCKNWVKPEYNPNGLRCGFKLLRGCYFHPTSSWTKEIRNEQSYSNGQTRQRY